MKAVAGALTPTVKSGSPTVVLTAEVLKLTYSVPSVTAAGVPGSITAAPIGAV